MNINDVCECAFQAFKSQAAAKLAVMFKVGEAMKQLCATKKFNHRDGSLSLKKVGEYLRDYCQVRAAKNPGDYRIPTCNAYYATAYNTATMLSEDERQTLLTHSVPWREMTWLFARGGDGLKMIQDLKDGKLKAIRQPRPDNKRRREYVKEPPTDHPMSQDYSVMIQVKRRGEIQHDLISDHLAHLIGIVGVETMDELWASARRRAARSAA